MKKILTLWALGTFAIIMVCVGITFAFFNYTRTGESNIVKTGDIFFETDYESTTLENVVPIQKENVLNDTENVMEVNVNIKGSTTYKSGIDYIISAKDVNSIINDKTLPISANITSNVPDMQIRNYEDESIIVENAVLAQGTILPSHGNVDGVLTIRAYINDENITISDTLVDADFTTDEWNSFETSGLSFKIKVQAWEHEETFFDMMLNNASMDNVASDFVSSETGVDFSQNSSDENGKGLYIRSGTENNLYPIVYYRGSVDNNNVLFADFCWKAIRTTETGGVKLIYNGIPTNGTCNNTGTASQLSGSSKYEESITTLSNVGYMNNISYDYINESPLEDAYFGLGFTYENGKYTLTNSDVGYAENRHYTCNSNDALATCETIRYYYHTGYYIELTDGKSVEDAMNEMLYDENVNKNDSIAKTNLETWFKNNMLSYIDQLEDTVWCSDRNIPMEGNFRFEKSGWDPNGGQKANNLHFYGFDYIWGTYNPILNCDNATDRFQVSNKKAKAKYPVGLITVSEGMLAGATITAYSSHYLHTGIAYWTMTPFQFTGNYASVARILGEGNITGFHVTNNHGLRPVVSLAFGMMINDGDGTVNNPYVVGNY
ncbi:MAG: hypothetical protein IJO27_00445 [Bacilli bacterium]|nr:hypothetical protein [Bacilli bacterium]